MFVLAKQYVLIVFEAASNEKAFALKQICDENAPESFQGGLNQTPNPFRGGG